MYSIVNCQCWFQTLYSVFFTNERNGTKTFRLKSRKKSLFQELPIQLKKKIVLCKSGYLDNIPWDSYIAIIIIAIQNSVVVLHILLNLKNNSRDHSQKNQKEVFLFFMTMLRQSSIYLDNIAFYQIKKEIYFNINQSFRKTCHRLVFCSRLVYFIYVLCHLPGTEKNIEFLDPASEKQI